MQVSVWMWRRLVPEVAGGQPQRCKKGNMTSQGRIGGYQVVGKSRDRLSRAARICNRLNEEVRDVTAVRGGKELAQLRLAAVPILV